MKPFHRFPFKMLALSLAHTPDEVQGRANGASRLIAMGGAPLGMAVTGLLLRSLGPQPTVLLSVAGQGLLALAATANRHIRTVARESGGGAPESAVLR